MSACPETPAKVVDDEALDARGLGSIDHGDLMLNSRGSDCTHDGILARQRFGELVDRIGGPDDWYAWREVGPGLKAGDDGHLKAVVPR